MLFHVCVADKGHSIYATAICGMMEEAAKVRGTGIAKRQPAYISKKMEEGKAVIALLEGIVVGFCYIESWEDQKYVANSGLIIHPQFRKTGLAQKIKNKTFELSKTLYPNAKLFGITTSMAVMKINASLGYKPVTFSELTKDDTFWDGCKTCVNRDILERTNRQMCLCTGMVCDLSKVNLKDTEPTQWSIYKNFVTTRKDRWKKFLPSFSKKIKSYEK